MDKQNFDYQGKRPDQVKNSNVIAVICVGAIFIGAIIYGLVKLIKWII